MKNSILTCLAPKCYGEVNGIIEWSCSPFMHDCFLVWDYLFVRKVTVLCSMKTETPRTSDEDVFSLSEQRGSVATCSTKSPV